MPYDDLSDLDDDDGDVRIALGRGVSDVRIVEHYAFSSSILQQPAKFSLTLSGRDMGALLAKYPPGPTSRCALYVGKYRQFTGELDAVDASGDATRTTAAMTGRDLMARLHDQDITGDRSFANATYEELFRAALEDTGLENRIVEISNTANRKIRSGVAAKVNEEPVVVAEVRQTKTAAGFKNTVTAKMGESWLTFLERHFKKLGLFAWCDANGNFVLSRPNADQEPTFHFYRKKVGNRATSNVERFSWKNDTTMRFSEVVVFARNHGRKHGKNHTNGAFVDQDMVNLGFDRRRVFRDAAVNSAEEAEFYARSKIAETNRAAVRLVYTISGHSAPTIRGGKRAIIVPDMVARIDDDELGIHDNMYIESVEYQAPPRQSVVTLMRTQDILFGEFQAKEGAKKAAKKPPVKPRVVEESHVIYGMPPIQRAPIDFNEQKDPTPAPAGPPTPSGIRRGST